LQLKVKEDEEAHPGIIKLSDDSIHPRMPKKPWIISFLYGVAIFSFLTCVFVSHWGSASVADEFILFAGIGFAFLLIFYAELLRQI
tara:strand:- start:1138 stop:1395 length:258 start_codon:yes stop_codon:yes gene_type:complete